MFLSGSLIAKYIPNYTRIPEEKLFGKWDAKTGTYVDGMIDPDILQNMILYYFHLKD